MKILRMKKNLNKKWKRNRLFQIGAYRKRAGLDKKNVPISAMKCEKKSITKHLICFKTKIVPNYPLTFDNISFFFSLEILVDLIKALTHSIKALK